MGTTSSEAPLLTGSDRVVSFRCTACGACCNSAPQLSLPELFHHEGRFIGTLAIRRFSPFETFAAEPFESVRGPTGPELVLLAAQAFDEPLRGRCPALAADQRCTLELDRKPSQCKAVPLEPLLPDAMQREILGVRGREAAYMGASCIQPGERAGHLPLVVEQRVVDAGALAALAARRRELLADKRLWGRIVFELLRPELFDQPERLARVPLGGFLSLSLAPALAVVASASQRCKIRTIAYLNAQIELMAETLDAMASRPSEAQRELDGLLRASLALRSSLQNARGVDTGRPEAAELEALLGAGATA